MMQRMLAWRWILIAAVLIPSTLFGITSLNVKDFGAVGNGVVDDTEALRSALAEALKTPEAVLFFPPGYYRITTKDAAALEVRNAENFAIRFASGAMLVMDNGFGTEKTPCHAIAVFGPAHNLLFEGVNIRWAQAPEKPGFADALLFDGGGPDRQISKVRLFNCRLVDVPACAVEFTEVSDIQIRRLQLGNVRKHGVCFHGCASADILGVEGVGIQGDAMAFLPAAPGSDGADADVPESGNCRVLLRQLDLRNCFGNGVRFGGVSEGLLEMSGFQVRGAAVLVESGLSDESVQCPPPGKITLSDLEMTDCGSGVVLTSHNASDPKLRDFSRVKVDQVRLNNSGNDNFLAESVDGVVLNGVKSLRSRIRLIDIGAFQAKDWSLREGSLFLDGASALPADSVRTFNRIRLDRAELQLRRVCDASFVGLSISDSPARALTIADCSDLTFDQMRLTRPNRASRDRVCALGISDSTGIVFDQLRIDLDSRRVVPIALTGSSVKAAGTLRAPSNYCRPEEYLALADGADGRKAEPELEIEVSSGGQVFQLQSDAASGKSEEENSRSKATCNLP